MVCKFLRAPRRSTSRAWGFVLASFSPFRYPQRMIEPDPKLTLATPDDLADTLSFALRHEGRKSQHDSDKLNSDIVAIGLGGHL
jgi:hypothetical protein